MKLRLMLAAWITALVFMSLSPLSFKLKLHTQGPIHAWLHYGVFAVTALFLCQVFQGPLARAFAFIMGCALALTQEWAENWIYHAGFEYKDVASDFAGLVTGFAVMILVSTLMTQSQHSSARRLRR